MVSLGAGYDTTFWNLREKDLCAVRYIELDFKDVTSRKCRYITGQKELLKKIQVSGK